MWSQKYNTCIQCGANNIPHKAKGLCTLCYEKMINKKYGTFEKTNKRYIHNKILTKEFLKKEYIDNQKSIYIISKEIGIDRRTVWRYLNKYNIKSRTYLESHNIALKNGRMNNGEKIFHHIKYGNEDFFKIWSNEMAYVLGVLYTDGNLFPAQGRDPDRKTTSQNPRVSLYQKDPELLEKVLKLMDCDAVIYSRKEYKVKNTTAGAIHFFSLNNWTLYNDLINIGMMPNKSKIIEFPKSIPDEFVSHFIRGCWDGNGSITNIKKAVNARIVSGSEKFIFQLREKLENFEITEGKIYQYKSGNAYTLYYYGWRGDKLLSFLYNDSSEEIRLNRKYESYQTHLKLNDSSCVTIQNNIS